jgi:hypothetical protein
VFSMGRKLISKYDLYAFHTPEINFLCFILKLNILKSNIRLLISEIRPYNAESFRQQLHLSFQGQYLWRDFVSGSRGRED